VKEDIMKKSNLLTLICLISISLSGCNTQVVTKPDAGGNKPQTQATPTASPLVTGPQTHTTTTNNPDGKDYTPAASQPALDKPFDIKVDNTAEISSEGLKIKLTGIEDSRCATDVQCIWAGNVKVKLNISKDNKTPVDIEIVTEPGQTEGAVQKFENYQITLNKVSPESKKSTETVKPSDYTISLTVSKN
jgi:outer membrane lipoprotein SlyB